MLVFDVETDGLLDEMTVIHCLNMIDRTTGKRLRFNGGVYHDGTPARRDGSVEDGVRLLEQALSVCGHNIIGFDLKAIKKLFPWFTPPTEIHDTIVYTRLIWPNLGEIDANAIKLRKRPPQFHGKLVGSHGLEAWGMRLGNFKGDYSKLAAERAVAEGAITPEEISAYVWGRFTRDMDDYCAQDNDSTLSLMERIEAKEYSPDALQLEIDVASIISLQVDHGFLFDTAAAEALTATLGVRRAALEDALRETFKPWWEPKRYKGAHEVLTPKTRNSVQGYTAGSPLTKVQEVVFNPGSRAHIANRMTTLFGWTPVEFTPTGDPKVDETTLEGLDYPEAKLIVEYLTVQKRLGQIAEGDAAWLKAVKPDGRIHGRVNTNGAVTGRMSHFGPNMAQVPKIESLYGSACRACFIVPEGYRLVGCDAEGLELRMLAHYMARFDGGAYVKAVAFGDKSKGEDAHSINQRVVGLRSRDSAKTFIYAYLYGAGNPKLGSIVYDDMAESDRDNFNSRVRNAEAKSRAAGQDPAECKPRMLGGLGLRARKRIEEGLPALGQLQELIKSKAKRGFIKSLDGRLLPVRSMHAALNTTLQGGGAVVMKLALVLCYRRFLALGWQHGREFAFVANIHDEFQMEVLTPLAQTAGENAAEAIREAGETYGLQCPLAGAYQVGLNWADSH